MVESGRRSRRLQASCLARACGIELYLGQAALSAGGKLRPDRRRPSYRYVSGRSRVRRRPCQEAFFAAMRDGGSSIDTDFPEMQLVWKTILDAIARTAERAQAQGRRPPPGYRRMRTSFRSMYRGAAAAGLSRTRYSHQNCFKKRFMLVNLPFKADYTCCDRESLLCF